MIAKRLLALGTASFLCAGSLVACSSDEQDSAIRIGVDRRSTKSVVIAELYRQSLERGGHTARLQALVLGADDTQADVQRIGVQMLEQESIDLVPACIGTVLRNESPNQAAELSEDYAADVEADEVDDVEWMDTAYNEMMGSLRRGVDAANPSLVSGCPLHENEPLPENIVPLFRKTALDRGDRVRLNNISGGITAAELEDLVEQVRGDDDISTAVSLYLDTLG